MKNKKIDLEIVFWFSIFILVFILSIIGMFLLFPNIADKDKASYWTELIKILFSSILSAAVAYGVSAIQIRSSQSKKEAEDKEINQNRMKILLIEIQDNKEVFDLFSSKGFPSGCEESLRNQISLKVLNMYFDKLIIEDETLKKLIKYEKKISLFLGNKKVESMQSSYQQLNGELESLITVLKKVNTNH